MIKEALQYIVGLKAPTIQCINGDNYSDRELHRIDTYFPKAARLEMTTLGSVIDYINANVDDMADKMIVHVLSPERVILFSQLDNNREREYLVDIKANIPEFDFGHFMDQERFCINLQSKFIDEFDRSLLLKFAGTVEAGTVAEYGDNGVSQKATVRTGIASKSEAIIPSPVKLKPFRTFLEVEQPESDFIFRMRESRGIECAIFEADGGAWKMEAMQNIKEYLAVELDTERFTVIA